MVVAMEVERMGAAVAVVDMAEHHGEYRYPCGSSDCVYRDRFGSDILLQLTCLNVLTFSN